MENFGYELINDCIKKHLPTLVNAFYKAENSADVESFIDSYIEEKQLSEIQIAVLVYLFQLWVKNNVTVYNK